MNLREELEKLKVKTPTTELEFEWNTALNDSQDLIEQARQELIKELGYLNEGVRNKINEVLGERQ